MAISSQFKLLFTAGSLLAATFANPLVKRLHDDDDDDDDTPLPVVIWHGKKLLRHMSSAYPDDISTRSRR